ncbi:hypothetical protein FACS1894211_06600 [Clostridia bacterium]|nr:hypothetical protein FACS1894211_06600 [Clostridia bacterium]
MFCTSTLIEGVNLPADNLFVTSYMNGPRNMTAVDFKNLIGRVGRINYNLYGHVHLITQSDASAKRVSDKAQKYEELLKSPAEVQQLSLVSELALNQKQSIVATLLQGKTDFPECPPLKEKTQTHDNYNLMRKFGLILVRDIVKNRGSLVRRAFDECLTPEQEAQIKILFEKTASDPDNDDINLSYDQTERLAAAIANGLRYPTLDATGYIDHEDLYSFLIKLCGIFNWEKYERDTLGHIGKNWYLGKINLRTGKPQPQYGRLSWYSVILSQWLQGHKLGVITQQAIRHKERFPESGIELPSRQVVRYEETSLYHKNLVISGVLSIIDKIILFSIANYFLRFSNEYKKFHKVDSFDNDWYEYVEYGTTNPESIQIQRYGFSREVTDFIKTHKQKYVIIQSNGEIRLRRCLETCGDINVQDEVKDMLNNSPELFVD